MDRPKFFITKNGSLNNFKTVSKNNFTQFQYGEILSSSNFPLTSSIIPYYVTSGQNRSYVKTLENTLNYYKTLSSHYSYDSSLGNKETQDLTLVSIPSIFYGSSIRKRSLSCKWYLTGTLIAELQDINGNGELVQIGPSGSIGSGSVAGVVLYKEGFVVLTGSWSLHDSYTDLFGTGLTYYPPSWKYFMNLGTSEVDRTPSSSFNLEFEGTNVIPTMTIMAHADKGEFNHSNNLTYVNYGQSLEPITSSTHYIENSNLQIKNIVSSSFTDEEPDFIKTTYISKIGIYDENKNLIGVAKLANPVRKREVDSYTFKLKLDL